MTKQVFEYTTGDPELFTLTPGIWQLECFGTEVQPYYTLGILRIEEQTDLYAAVGLYYNPSMIRLTPEENESNVLMDITGIKQKTGFHFAPAYTSNNYETTDVPGKIIVTCISPDLNTYIRVNGNGYDISGTYVEVPDGNSVTFYPSTGSIMAHRYEEGGTV